MACCGDRRAELTPGMGAVRPASPPPVPPSGARVPLRFVGPAPMALRGTASGEVYRLAEGSRDLVVDARDADALLRTRWFVRA